MGPVQKRLEAQLRALRKFEKWDKNGKVIRFGEKGHLTDKLIDAPQAFNRGAIWNYCTNDLQ